MSPADEFALQLGFTSAWFEAGVVDEVRLSQIKVFWEQDDDRNAEHYRYGAFCRFMQSQHPLSREIAAKLYALGNCDPDSLMGGSMMAAILRRPECPRELLAAAAASGRKHLVKIAREERRYQYVGPAELLRPERFESPRILLTDRSNVENWLSSLPKNAGNRTTVTFVVLTDGLWVADRQSEHVACARGGEVYSAGDLTLAFQQRGLPIAVVEATNQSTGYCPEAESWFAVQRALSRAGIRNDLGEFTTKLIFRRCPKCAATNVVKEEWFPCELCNAELPANWNFDFTSQ